MGDGLKAEVKVLETEGKNFDSLGDDFNTAVETLKNSLTALEQGDRPPWGGDDLGEKFGVVYEGLRDGMYESMGHLAAELKRFGGALQQMGKNHEEGESFSEAMMDQEVQNAQAESQLIQQVQGPTV